MLRKKPKSDRIMAKMRAIGPGSEEYDRLSADWEQAVAEEWHELSCTMTREEQEAFLATGEEQVARSVERIANDMVLMIGRN